MSYLKYCKEIQLACMGELQQGRKLNPVINSEILAQTTQNIAQHKAISSILHLCIRMRTQFKIIQGTWVKVNHSTAAPSKDPLTLFWNDGGLSVGTWVYMSRSHFAKLVPDVLAKTTQPYCLCKEQSEVDTTEVHGK